MEQDEKKNGFDSGSDKEKPVENSADDQENVKENTDENEEKPADEPENGQAASETEKKVFKISIGEQNEGKTDDESQDDAEDKKEKKKRPLLKAFIYTFGVIVASILLAVFILYSVTDYIGMFRADKSADITITKTDTVGNIAAKLKDNGIIRSSFIFSAYVKLSSKTDMRQGKFSLNSQMSYDAIIRELRSAAARETVKVTIPEGYTLQKTGELLESKKVCTKQEFLTAVQKTDVKFDFNSQIPNSSQRFYRLEGYLFPDTYEFYVGQAPDTVVKKMLDNFDKRINDELRKKIKDSGMTTDQVITLASIIQAEAGKTEEMPKVSSVFHNRLSNGVDGQKMLQSDATIFYATRDIVPILSKDSTETASAYNTYKHEGLPPGPICNPGLNAIDAALNPEPSNNYFFVTDSKGNYYYSDTYSKHLTNVKKAMKTGKALGTNVTDSEK